MPTITHTDNVYQVAAAGLNVVPGIWVRLLNNSTSTNYFSTAVTDAQGAFTHSAPPGDYSLYTGNAATVPGTPTLRNSHYSVPVTAGDDVALGSLTALSGSAYASSTYATANPGSASIAGPQPWIDVTAPSVTVASVTYTLGALFNGTGDDGVPINNAYTAALNVPTGGAIVLMPPGTGRVATQIVPVNNATLQGAGDGATTLQWFGGNNVPMIGNAAPSGTNFLSKSHFKFFKLDTRNTTGVNGVVLNSWYQSVMEDVWITNAATLGGLVALTIAVGATGGSAAYNWIRGVRLTSCDVGMKLSGNNVNGVVTNNSWYGLDMDDVTSTAFIFDKWNDTNTFFGTRVAARSGVVWTGMLFNNTATPNADVGVYNVRFFGLALDCPTGLAGTNAITGNWCYGVLIEGLWTSIGPGGSTGTLINDTNGGTNMQSYRIELMESTGVPGSKATQYVKGYVKARSRQVVPFVTPYTPDPTAGEIIEFGTLTASVTINAPSPQPAQATGQLLTFRFTENATGNWTVAWNPIFKTGWQPNPQPNAISEITFYWDGTNYQQLFANLIDNLGRVNTPAELIVGQYLITGSAVIAGTYLKSGKATPAYSASITPDAAGGNWQTITVTNGTAFTINAPTNPPASTATQELTIEVLNSSGGAMGVITWNAAFVFQALVWTNPANTFKRFVTFKWNGLKWVANALSTADY